MPPIKMRIGIPALLGRCIVNAFASNKKEISRRRVSLQTRQTQFAMGPWLHRLVGCGGENQCTRLKSTVVSPVVRTSSSSRESLRIEPEVEIVLPGISSEGSRINLLSLTLHDPESVVGGVVFVFCHSKTRAGLSSILIKVSGKVFSHVPMSFFSVA